jgi:3D (Asp-Asp-Asp) domain-containing protein
MQKSISLSTAKPAHLAVLIGIFGGFGLIVMSLSSVYFSSRKWVWQSPIVLRSPIIVENVDQKPIIQYVEIEKEEELEEQEIEEEDQFGVELRSETEAESLSRIAKVTAYSCGGITTTAEKMMNCPNGVTATGVVPEVGMMACDRANLGRTFYVEGFGELICTDTGGAIKGAGRFDVYLPTIQEARVFGVQELAYYLVE